MPDGSTDQRTARVSAEEALAMHASGRPGKLETRITKPLTTARDLSLAYSPGVAGPAIWQPVFTKSISGLLYNYASSTPQVEARPLLDRYRYHHG